MPAAAWHVCLPGKSGSDRQALKTALRTQKRHRPMTAAWYPPPTLAREEARGSLCRTTEVHGHTLQCGGVAACSECKTGRQNISARVFGRGPAALMKALREG